MTACSRCRTWIIYLSSFCSRISYVFSSGAEQVHLLDVATEHKGCDGRQLHQDVDGWAGGVLEWIAYSVSDNGSNVQFSDFLLFLCNGLVFGGIWMVWAHGSDLLLDGSKVDSLLLNPVPEGGSLLLDFLFAVIPCTACV